MANDVKHAALPFPVKKARYTVFVPYLDADGDPLDPTTPDTEVSKDAGAFADCAEEVSTISGSNGSGYLTLTGAEMDASLVVLAAKVASGPKATLLEVRPRVLPVVTSGTAQGGASGSITLASGASAADDFYNGCIVRTTGGTGGGGTGGANNQARVITDYNGTTKVATVEPNWETAPGNTTTYEVLLTDMAVNAVQAGSATVSGTVDANVIKWSGTSIPGVDTAGYPKVTVKSGTGAGELDLTTGRVKALVGLTKNVAFNNFEFLVTDSDLHQPLTGLVDADFTKTHSKDGGAFAALSGTITEVGNGFYKINLTATELNANNVVLRFAASGADDTALTLFPSQ